MGRRGEQDSFSEQRVLATEDDEWRVRQAAAAALSSGRRFYTHRPLLERLVETWPDGERSEAGDEVRDALSEGPHSIHWEQAALDGELREAHRQLRSPTSEDAHRSAFHTLLRGRRTDAQGIALDHYCLTDGLRRFGIDCGEYAAEVLAIARGILGQPSSAAGADHASALYILEELGEPEDAEPIVAALRAKKAPAVVRECAVDAAWECLERWETPDEEIVAALEGLIFRRAAHPGGRRHRPHVPRLDRRAPGPVAGGRRVVAAGRRGTGRDRPARAGRWQRGVGASAVTADVQSRAI